MNLDGGFASPWVPIHASFSSAGCPPIRKEKYISIHPQIGTDMHREAPFFTAGLLDFSCSDLGCRKPNSSHLVEAIKFFDMT
jgi:hypothetical protein